MTKISIFNRQYPVTDLMIQRSRFLSTLLNDVYMDTDLIKFKFTNKDSWEWIYNELNQEYGDVFYDQDPDIILQSIPILTYLDVPIMLDNIFKMINYQIFTIVDLLENYSHISKSPLLKYATILFFIKRFFSIDNLLDYISNFDMFISDYHLKDKYFYLDTLPNDIENVVDKFETNNLIEDIPNQNNIFGSLLDNFVLLTLPSQFLTIDIPDFSGEIDNDRITRLTSKIPQTYITNILELEGNYFPDFSVIILDLRSVESLDILKTIDPHNYIYRFNDPFTGEEYFITHQERNMNYLAFNYENPFFIYPIASATDFADNRLKKWITVADLNRKTLLFQNDNIYIVDFNNNSSLSYKDNIHYIYGELVK